MRFFLMRQRFSSIPFLAGLLALCACFLPAPAGANITGTVFVDLNANGVQDGSEAGIAGIEVRAFNGANVQVGATATTLASGGYTLTGLGGAQVRLELNIPAAQSYLKNGPGLAASGNTAVVFATDPATGVGFAVSEPGQFCQANPRLGANCYIEYEQSTNTQDVLISFPFTAGCDGYNGDGDCTDGGESGTFTTPAPTHSATAQQAGTTWGLAYQPVTDTLFASSFMKRHSGFRTFGATGVIYRVANASTAATTVTPYVDFDALGIDTGTDPHPQPTDSCTSAANGNTNNLNCWSHDANSWDGVGKMAFGDLEISDDLTELWTVNLFDRRLYRIPVQAAPVTLGDITSFAVPIPGDCTAADVRPFGLGYYRQQVWLGMVCSAQSTVPGGFAGGQVTVATAPGNTASLRAYVYSFNGSTFTQRVNFPLNYGRGCIFGNGSGTTCNGLANWHPWVPVFTFLNLTSGERGYPQPMLTDVEFDNGNMILGLRDRSGDQFGFQQRSTNSGSATLHTGDAAGDTLRLCASGGAFVLEGSPGCPSNAANGQGPGGGEYYFQDGWFSPNFRHDETTMGGLAQVPGSPEVVVSLYDPFNADAAAFSGGFGWFNNTTGAEAQVYQVFTTADSTGGAFYGKANGLGDVEAFCFAAPQQIGNRLWVDSDGDGIQDPGEAGIPNITVELWADPDGNGIFVLVGTAVTGAGGTYLFGGIGNFNMLGGEVVEPNTAYQVRIDLSDPQLSPTLIPTIRDYNGNSGNGDLHDSDGDTGALNPGYSTIVLTTGGPGQSNHNADGGFSDVLMDYGDLPDGPYATLFASNGAQHAIRAGLSLGVSVDDDVNGQPTAAADGDDTVALDDEEGVIFLDPLVPGRQARIQVTTTLPAATTGRLLGFIDFDGNGVFDGDDQPINAVVNTAGVSVQIFTITVPADATGVIYSRFRFGFNADLAGFGPAGRVASGEVEDFALASIGNRVWLDDGSGGGGTGDGIQNGAEPGVPGITVQLLNVLGVPVLDANSNPITTVTNGTGLYEFPGLAPGDYRIGFVLPAGFQFTVPGQGTAATGSDADPLTGLTGTVTVTAGQARDDIDAGVVATGARAALGNYVWLDENSDGVQDAGEPGIPNVRVVLRDSGGLQLAETLTDANGGYLFRGLAAGTYFVDVDEATLATGLTQTPPSTFPGADFGNQSHAGNGYSITLGPGQENLTGDFGYNWNPSGDVNNPAGGPTAALGDRIWIDADGDGVQDPNEIGAAGVTVNLLADPDGDGIYTLAATVMTDANGNYIFDGLMPGAYQVQVVVAGGPLAGYAQTGDPDDPGMPAGAPDNLTTAPVILGPGDVYLNADFGYQPPVAQNNSVGDTIWFDIDGDGVEDAGEPGIPGVTVSLLNAAGDVIATTTTDANGGYGFSGLPDGMYQIWVNDTDNVLGELTNTGDPDGGFDSRSVVDLDSAGTNPAPASNQVQDFGYAPPGHGPVTGLIGDTIFLDVDGDGVPDPGEGIEGVTVTLDDGLGNVVTTITDENGNYSFGGLNPAGTYTVTVDTSTLPAGLVNTVDPDDDGINNNGDENSTSVVNLAADPDGVIDGFNVQQDFGYRPADPKGLGNLLWLDTDADGFFDGVNGGDGLPGTDDDEPAIGGVTVDIYVDVDGDGQLDPGEPRIGSTTTQATLDSTVPLGAAGNPGNYVFDFLPPGNYVIDVSDRAGVLGGYWHSLGISNANHQSDPDPRGEATDATRYRLRTDFGYYREPGALGNRVFNDFDADGIQDPTEVGIPGVPVTLTITYPDGTVSTIVTLTGPDGSYSFDNLLLDEDYDGVGTAATPGVGGGTEPHYRISIATPLGMTPSPIDQGAGANQDLLDSDNHAGVQGIATQGLTDTTLQADPSTEPTIASYDFGFRSRDFGDLPAPYPTTLAGSGAVHGIAPGVYLGSGVDAETDGVPSANADGDDTDAGGDDEDGITFLTPIIAGSFARLQVIANSAGFLNAWADYSGFGGLQALALVSVDGTPMGGTLTDLPLSAGSHVIEFRIPNSTNPFLPLYHRFRFTADDPGNALGVANAWPNGEVEDYLVRNQFDFGDAPASYGTTRAANGPTHALTPGFQLGALADADADGVPNAAASGDDLDLEGDDEDGVDFGPGGNGAGSTGNPLTVTLTNVDGRPAFLDAWIDFDGNGTFDAAEKLFGGASQPLVAGVNNLTYDIPADAVPMTQTYARFRLSSAGNKGPTDPFFLAADGEIEDYAFDAFATPVTLAHFRADRSGRSVRFTWSTATETSNLGFDLYGKTSAGWQQLNEELIRSHRIDSLAPQSYSYLVESTDADSFILVDLDIRARERMHGPYDGGRDHGAPVIAEEIEWAKVRSESSFALSQLKAERGEAISAKVGIPLVDLGIREPGIHRLSYEQLAAAGLDLKGRLNDEIAITHRGAPVPIWVDSIREGRFFGPGSYLELVAEPKTSLYTEVDVYRLWLDPSRALRVAIDKAPPEPGKPVTSYLERERIDRNVEYSFASPTGDPWYETDLLAFTSQVSKSFPVEVDRLLPNEPATLDLRIWGVTDWPQAPDHHVRVAINGLQVAERTFDGLVDVPISVKLAGGVLHEGTNTLTLTLPGDTGADFDLIHVDTYGVSYARELTARDGRLSFEGVGSSFEAGGFASRRLIAYRQQLGQWHRVAHPRVLESGGSHSVLLRAEGKWLSRHFVATDGALPTPTITASASTGSLLEGGIADYLVISHPSFLAGLSPLLAQRQADGYRVKVVDVDAVYSGYSDGVVDPLAIQSYLRDARQALGTHLVLLVGADSYDYHDNLGIGSISFVPTLYAATHPVVAFTPSDALLADLDGDGLQDLAIGRFPVRTPTELEVVIDKTLAYGAGGYARRAIFAADQSADGLDFSSISDDVLGALPESWSVWTAYLDQQPIGRARTALLGMINEGVALTHFVGHSGPAAWTFANLFTNADAAGLTNAGRPTVVSQWGCWNTYHVSPRFDTLGHKLMASGDRGAAAVLGSTTLTSASSTELLSRRLMEWMVSGRPLGDALLEAKRELAAEHPDLLDVLYGWTLLGDPALRVMP